MCVCLGGGGDGGCRKSGTGPNAGAVLVVTQLFQGNKGQKQQNGRGFS